MPTIIPSQTNNLPGPSSRNADACQHFGGPIVCRKGAAPDTAFDDYTPFNNAPSVPTTKQTYALFFTPRAADGLANGVALKLHDLAWNVTGVNAMPFCAPPPELWGMEETACKNCVDCARAPEALVLASATSGNQTVELATTSRNTTDPFQVAAISNLHAALAEALASPLDTSRPSATASQVGSSATATPTHTSGAKRARVANWRGQAGAVLLAGALLFANLRA